MRKKLINWEKQHGYKARYVAGRIGVTDAQWSRIKLGKQAPTLEQAERFQKEFGVENVFDLFKEEKDDAEFRNS